MKPANVLISGGELKIADFGFAKKNVTRKMKNETAVGTPLYMSLELLKGEPYSSKCDIWAVGFMFYELLHHRPPWTAGSVYELIKNIEKKPLAIDERLSSETKDFLRKTLGKAEKERIEWDQVFEHPIFNGYFDQFRMNNKKIEDKLKVVMNGLRFKINSENIDVSKLFHILGFRPESELKFAQFHKFLDYISPRITEEEVRFFFDKVDEDESGSISISEIEKEMARHNIVFDLANKLRKANTYQEDEEGRELSEQLAEKAKKCFERLYRVLNYKKISLKKTFQAYDRDGNGNLTFECFKNMISRLDNSFTEDDIVSVFEVIDRDKSKTIEFDELNAYYCKVNGLPFTLDESAI